MSNSRQTPPMAGRGSRKHPEGSDAHFAHQDYWQMQKSKGARRDRAEERQAAREHRSDREQIARLDRLLGDGVGAVRERARLGRV